MRVNKATLSLVTHVRQLLEPGIRHTPGLKLRVRSPFFLYRLVCALMVATLLSGSPAEAQQQSDTSFDFERYASWLEENVGHRDFLRYLLFTSERTDTLAQARNLLEEHLGDVPAGNQRRAVLLRLGYLTELGSDLEAAAGYYAQASLNTDSGLQDYASLLRAGFLYLELGQADAAFDAASRIARGSDIGSVRLRARILQARSLSYMEQQEEAAAIIDALFAEYEDVPPVEVMFAAWDVARSLTPSQAQTLGLDAPSLGERLQRSYPRSIEASIIGGSDSISLASSPSRILPASVGSEMESEPLTPQESSVGPDDAVGPDGAAPAVPSENAGAEAATESTVSAIQIGSYTVEENATEHVRELRETGEDARTIEVTVDGRQYYRVYIPIPETRRDPAGVQRFMLELRDRGIEGIYIFDQPAE